VGADIDRALVEQLNHGASPDYQEEDLAAQLARVVREGRFQATTDTPAAVKQASTVIVVVPLVTGQDGAPDYRHIDAATAEIALALRRGQLVIYETTLPVGDTRERFAAALGRAASLAPGTDFHVAFSPERVYMGRIFEDLGRY